MLLRRARTRLAALALDHRLLVVSLDGDHAISEIRAALRIFDGALLLLHGDLLFSALFEFVFFSQDNKTETVPAD
jgi:hypothetical protein